jgi:hypothetical protein
MTEHPGGEEYVVHLRALADDTPAVIRLRAALKRFRRSFNFVATKVEEVRRDERPAQQQHPG